MIRHILTIIWNERRINSGILLEYVLVFCILWFCSDYLYYMGKNRTEPLGYDISHIYQIQIGADIAADDAITKEERYTYAMTMAERIQHYPGVESVCFSNASIPYSSAFMSRNYLVESDSAHTTFQLKTVSPSFFDVFKISITSGQSFQTNDQTEYNHILISPDRHNRFCGFKIPKVPHPINQVHQLKQPNDDKSVFMVTGITDKLKNNYSAGYKSVIFALLKKEDYNPSRNDIMVRIRPEADQQFAERFTSDMRTTLQVGPYFLTSVEPFDQIRTFFLDINRISSNLNSIYSITAFLIINIFLGIIGTFWYRTQARRSEIGLRIAMGATKQTIKTMLCVETLLLLLLSSIIGVNICLNINQTDLLKTLGIPTADNVMAESGIEQYFINYALTFGFLAIVSLAAVWYPARQATAVPPVEALREE